MSYISIHAPLTGSDYSSLLLRTALVHFNPRSPHRERRKPLHRIAQASIFQSTLPSQGATLFGYFIISNNRSFQSTLPSQGATSHAPSSGIPTIISIHAPLTGSDARMRSAWGVLHFDFNPRSPHRERQRSAAYQRSVSCISIHAPLTGSDKIPGDKKRRHSISIHAPLTGSDACNAIHGIVQRNFNPRSPHRERPFAAVMYNEDFTFQSTLPSQGATNTSNLLL